MAQLIIQERRKEKKYINIEADLHPNNELPVISIELQYVNPSWWLINLSKPQMIILMITNRLKKYHNYKGQNIKQKVLYLFKNCLIRKYNLILWHLVSRKVKKVLTNSQIRNTNGKVQRIRITPSVPFCWSSISF